MIPPDEPETGCLPPGIYEATWAEILTRYGYNAHRLRLLAGFKSALDSLREAGCTRAYLDGSFVTAKETPNDFDACWEMTGVDFDVLDQRQPTVLDWTRRRAAQKALFGGELFIAEAAADPWGTPYLEFFQREGIIALTIGDLP